MSYRIIVALALTLATAPGCLLAQVSTADVLKYPRIFVKLPENISSDKVAIWYLLEAQQGRKGRVKPQQNVRQYIINAGFGGQPAQSATIYVYSPGCQFQVYDFDLSDKSVVEQQFECVALPKKSIHGFILPTEIPLNFFSQPTKLDISGELAADWICSDVFRRVEGGGSCGTPSIPLGKVGMLDPSDGGNFELIVPDFTKDPIFTSHHQRSGAPFGFIALSLKDRQVGRTVGTLALTDVDSPNRRLDIEADYPDPVVFTSTQ
jgi:hypothetical protein